MFPGVILVGRIIFGQDKNTCSQTGGETFLINIRTAQSIQDLNAVYQFWYHIYVEEMSRHTNDPLVCHDIGGLFDWMTLTGDLIIAERHQGERRDVVGSLLATPLSDPATVKYRSLYQLENSPSEHLRVSCTTTKFMLAPELRATRLPMRLLLHAYDHGLRSGIHFNYMDCNDHLVPMFERLGFRRHLPEIDHPVYGKVNSMCLPATDHIHLAEVRSPFLKVLLRFNEEQGLDSAYLRKSTPSQEQPVGALNG